MNNYFLYNERDLALMPLNQKINLIKAARTYIDRFNIHKLKDAFFYKHSDLHSPIASNMFNTKALQDFLRMTHEGIIDYTSIKNAK